MGTVGRECDLDRSGLRHPTNDGSFFIPGLQSVGQGGGRDKEGAQARARAGAAMGGQTRSLLQSQLPVASVSGRCCIGDVHEGQPCLCNIRFGMSSRRLEGITG